VFLDGPNYYQYLQKGPYKMSVGHASMIQKTLSVIYDPAEKVKTSPQTDYFPPVLMTLWRTRKFTRGTICVHLVDSFAFQYFVNNEWPSTRSNRLRPHHQTYKGSILQV
jgi:hypothetical protein